MSILPCLGAVAGDMACAYFLLCLIVVTKTFGPTTLPLYDIVCQSHCPSLVRYHLHTPGI